MAEPYSYAQARELAAELGVSPVLGTVLARRGFADPVEARRFIEASDTHDPSEFRGIDVAAALLVEHVRRGSVITVHGDYDVDGVCSTAILVRTLRRLGGEVRSRIPSRMDDGYGLSLATVRDLQARGVGLLVTADCGIGALEEVAAARAAGMDVIVTDHHRPGEQLPDCPVVHPGVCGYPADLCATGVAYKLAQAAYTAAGRDAADLEDELDVVALATVADLVPLRGENRALVRRGLRALAGTARPGLRALMRVARVDPQSVDERTLGFALAPRINAAGRLYRADAGLELLLTEDEGRALEIARELDAINTERQSVETATLFEAERLLSEVGERREDPALVLAGEGWHPGVIGIVASRLVERYNRPCVLIALDGAAGRGSGRSISPYDLHAGLEASSEHLTRFGGHRMAAGLEIEADRIEPFRRALIAHARAALEPIDLVPVERVDAVVAGESLGLDLAEELERLRPFGMGNPGVSLLVPAARLSDVRPMGEGRHARFTVTSGGARARAVAFGVGGAVSAAAGQGDADGPRHDVVARLEVNEWRGSVEPRLVLRSLHDVPPAEGQATGSCAECGCRAAGASWHEALLGALDGPSGVPPPAGEPRGAPRKSVDSRGGGLGALADLLTTSERVLVACADVSRRRPVFDRELDPARFGRPRPVFASARCAAGAIEKAAVAAASAAGAAPRAVCVADHATLGERPELLEAFEHVFMLDPAPHPTLDRLVRMSAPDPSGESPSPGWFLHLGFGDAEVEFARRALEAELSLRPALAALYRELAREPAGLEGAALEAALTGAGRHPHTPVLAARCLRVLHELGLAEIDSSSGTLRCTIISDRRVELERSATYTACARICEEGLSFLGTLTQKAPSRRAA